MENRYGHLRELLEQAARAVGGETVTIDGCTYQRLWSRVDERRVRLGGPANVRVLDQESGKRINVTHAEDAAFWEWAIVEVLRHSGVRIEEALELTHLSIRQYQRPNSEVIALLVVAPSKSDRERVIPMSAELFAVVAAIVRRHAKGGETIPLLPRYDPKERRSSPPMPFLFQRKIGTKHEVISDTTIVNMLKRRGCELAEHHPGFHAASFTPHDFRRLLATDLVNSGLPIHIGAALLGHLNLQTTRGYVAVFNEDVIRHYQGFLARRRQARPVDEYRPITDPEWLGFEEHFDQRKVELGSCARPYGTPCQHEHDPLTELSDAPPGFCPRSTDSDSAASSFAVWPRQSLRVVAWMCCHRVSPKYGGWRRYGCQNTARRSGTLRLWWWPGPAGSRRLVIRCCPSGSSMSRAPRFLRSPSSCTTCSPTTPVRRR